VCSKSDNLFTEIDFDHSVTWKYSIISHFFKEDAIPFLGDFSPEVTGPIEDTTFLESMF
jgi:hypothetical protein